MATPIKTFKREADIEMYINILIDLVETRERPESRLNYFFLYFNKESNQKEFSNYILRIAVNSLNNVFVVNQLKIILKKRIHHKNKKDGTS